MKRNLMLVVAMMLGTIIFAQHRKGEGKHQNKVETMKTELSLNDTR